MEHGVGDLNALEGTATCEASIPNDGHCVGDLNMLQGFAGRKGRHPNADNGLGELNALKGTWVATLRALKQISK